ncbi:MAG: PKD domain-containing protein, partial [Bacteroidales bacterium]|nr:PKD domain-containing protein [Bacteroidales bacterium]
MKQNRNVIGFFFFAMTLLIFSSCAKEEIRRTFPLSASIFQSIADKQVAFTALTHSAVSWSWDFGDGQTSLEKDPVHVYNDGGYYAVILIATGSDGNSVTSEVDIAVAVTPYVLLTGGPTAANGKTWKLSPNQSPFDKFANADAELSTFDDTPVPLPQGVFD